MNVLKTIKKEVETMDFIMASFSKFGVQLQNFKYRSMSVDDIVESSDK